MKTWRQFLLGVIAKRSTRLMTVAQAVAPQRQVGSVKSAAMALGYFLKEAGFPMKSYATRLLETAVLTMGSGQLASYRGKVLLVIDPTEYAKRSRGRGKRGRGMQHIGRVRKSGGKSRKKGKKGTTEKKGMGQGQKVATTFGYVDIWAGAVLTGKGFLPLARQLFSSSHPKLSSQNQVEESVLFEALAVLGRVGLEAIAVGDRGLGRKELVIRLAGKGQDLVFRIDPDILARLPDTKEEVSLAQLLESQPYLGEVVWDRGQEGELTCQARKVRAAIRFSRSGRKDDYQEATVSFLELVPMEEGEGSLVLVTTLPVESLADAKGITRVYAERWAIETAFETMHASGQDRFMVRSFDAIDRLLWIVALAHALVVLALRDGKLAGFRDQAVRLLKQQAVLGRRLTVGKLVEAIGLDFARHRRAWAGAWLP
ncbi:MAG: transposase [Chloroflexota bacterium]